MFLLRTLNTRSFVKSTALKLAAAVGMEVELELLLLAPYLQQCAVSLSPIINKFSIAVCTLQRNPKSQSVYCT